MGRDVGAVVQALRVLRVLAGSREQMGMTAISRAADISPSTCLNLLRTLTNERLVGFDPGKKVYTLDLGVLELARPLINQAQVELLRPHLLSIATRYSALISVWLPSRDESLLLVDKVVPDVAVRVEMRLATKLPLAAGAAGRAVLAVMQPDEVELMRLFGQVRWVKPVVFAEFVKQVEFAQREGYSVDLGDLIGGVSSVATCLRNVSGVPVMAFSGAMLSGQHGQSDLQSLGGDLCALGRWAEKALYGGGVSGPADLF